MQPVPPPKFIEVAEVLIAALPRLAEVGVPVTVALRAIATATEAIGRHRDRSRVLQSWSRDQLALGFLLGADKFEWREGEMRRICLGECGAVDFSTAIRRLRDLFVPRSKQKSLTEYDHVFLDIGVRERAAAVVISASEQRSRLRQLAPEDVYPCEIRSWPWNAEKVQHWVAEQKRKMYRLV